VVSVVVVRRPGHPATLWLEAEDAAARGRDPDRAGAVDADRRRHEARGDSGRGPAAGPTGRPLDVPRVARHPPGDRLRERPQPQLGHGRLADDDRAGVAQAPHDLGVRGRPGRDRPCSAAGDLARDVDLVFDRHRDAEQRRPVAVRPALVRAIGIGKRSLGEHRAERVQLAVQPLDPSERYLDQLASRDLAPLHELGLRGHTVERDVVIEHGPPTLAALTVRVNDPQPSTALAACTQVAAPARRRGSSSRRRWPRSPRRGCPAAASSGRRPPNRPGTFSIASRLSSTKSRRQPFMICTNGSIWSLRRNIGLTSPLAPLVVL
jgi:hypothetical protein